VWHTLAAAGAAMVLGALAPTGMSAFAGPDRVASQAAATPAQGAKPAGANDRKPQPSRPAEWEWWNDADIRKQLTLSDEKIRKIDGMFRRREAEVQPWVDDLDRERGKLNRMTSDRLADDATYTRQVAKVEFLRSQVSESRTILLYRMFRELTPEQYRKLQEIGDKRRDDMLRRGQGSGR